MICVITGVECVGVGRIPVMKLPRCALELSPGQARKCPYMHQEELEEAYERSSLYLPVSGDSAENHQRGGEHVQ